MRIGNKALSDAEKTEMRKAVLECARELHRDGFRHGDEASRNIRAEKCERKGSLRSWLVDLELATLLTGKVSVGYESDMSFDVSRCQNLF